MADVTFDPVWAAAGGTITAHYAVIGGFMVLAMSPEGAAELRRQGVRFANEDEYPNLVTPDWPAWSHQFLGMRLVDDDGAPVGFP